MGKNKKKSNENPQSEHCPATVFVSKLPYSFTNSQLEDSFNDVGPIRRCFMVNKKGATEQPGIGFVQFATKEDAGRAIEMKNGSYIDSRKILVKLANHRAPLDQRRPKPNQAGDSDDTVKTENETDGAANNAEKLEKAPSVSETGHVRNETDSTTHDAKMSKKSSSVETDIIVKPPKKEKKPRKNKAEESKSPEKQRDLEIETVSAPEGAKVSEKDPIVSETGKSVKKTKKAKKPAKGQAGEGKSSEKQRVARTVILGGLLNPVMADEVIRCAKKIKGVCFIKHPLPKEELERNGLQQDGCRPEAASILYGSVRSACACVAALHQKEINGGSVWARRLGGEEKAPSVSETIHVENETDSTTHDVKMSEKSSPVPETDITVKPPKKEKKPRKTKAEKGKSPEKQRDLEIVTDSAPEGATVSAKDPNVSETGKSGKKTKKPVEGQAGEGVSSEKQRVARTVILGGLMNPVMKEEVIRSAKKFKGVCFVKYPLPKEELERSGLQQDGCRPEAASILYDSVRSACACVAALHQKEINGGSVWARQLGGEGSKIQKWKVIVRNLPFKATVSEIKAHFAPAGFVWDVFIPKNPETGLCKGFAFVKFTSKHDVENAILKFNGKPFGNRTIAVDWAVPKKVYTSSGTTTASEDGKAAEENNDSDADEASEDDKDDADLERTTDAPDEPEYDSDVSYEEVEDLSAEVNIDEEVELARKVLQNVMTSSTKEAPKPKKVVKPVTLSEKPVAESKPAKKAKSGNNKDGKQAETRSNNDEDDLPKTIFINNLPFDCDPEEVKQRFSSFGEVESFILVLHPVTKRPRGTGFLKFKTTESADASVSSAGIFFKGRQLKVLKALDKKSAHNIAEEKSKIEVQDHRNLYLAKEGLIVENTPAAEGVSAEDMAKRQTLQQKKMTKLQSPNFHVSKTRLVIYNTPKSMRPKELKKLCIDAVTSKASQQTPVIRQVKFLSNEKDGKVKNFSRGVAFVEFAEHQHAIVALRVLNNNPEPFGPQHRPIVEFAVDNVQTLRKRNLKINDQLQETGNVHEKDKNFTSTKPNDEKFRKRKFSSFSGDGDDPNSGKKFVKGNKAVVGDDIKDENSNKRMKRDRNDSMDRNPRNRKENNVMDRNPRNKKTNDRMDRNKKDNNNAMDKNPIKREGNDGMDRETRKRKANNALVDGDEGKRMKNNRKKNKEPIGRDMTDKLDILIEQYKSKYSKKTDDGDGKNQGSKQQIRRWFQS